MRGHRKAQGEQGRYASRPGPLARRRTSAGMPGVVPAAPAVILRHCGFHVEWSGRNQLRPEISECTSTAGCSASKNQLRATATEARFSAITVNMRGHRKAQGEQGRYASRPGPLARRRTSAGMPGVVPAAPAVILRLLWFSLFSVRSFELAQYSATAGHGAVSEILRGSSTLTPVLVADPPRRGKESTAGGESKAIEESTAGQEPFQHLRKNTNENRNNNPSPCRASLCSPFLCHAVSAWPGLDSREQ